MIETFGKVFYWLARIIATFNICLVIYMGIGEGFPNYFTLLPSEQYMFIAWFIMILSSIFAFKWELIFSIIIVISYLAFSYVNYLFSANHTFWTGYFFFLYPLSGLTFLFSWIINKKVIK